MLPPGRPFKHPGYTIPPAGSPVYHPVFSVITRGLLFSTRGLLYTTRSLPFTTRGRVFMRCFGQAGAGGGGVGVGGGSGGGGCGCGGSSGGGGGVGESTRPTRKRHCFPPPLPMCQRNSRRWGGGSMRIVKNIFLICFFIWFSYTPVAWRFGASNVCWVGEQPACSVPGAVGTRRCVDYGHA